MVDGTALAILKRQRSRGITIISSQRKIVFDIQLDPYWLKWQTKHSKLADNDFESSEFHQDMWNRYLILWSGSVHIPSNAISNLKLLRSYMAVHDDLVLPSAMTLINICRRDYALTVDAIKKRLPSQNKVSLALDGSTSPNKLTITLVIAYFMDENLALCEVQLAFNEVDHLFLSCFES